MIFAALLFLVVFTILSLARIKIDGEIAHKKTQHEINRLINIFFAITGTIIIAALILVIVSFAIPQEAELSLHATALLLAVIINLISRGAFRELQCPAANREELTHGHKPN